MTPLPEPVDERSRYVARVQFATGHIEEVSNLEECVLEWRYEDLDEGKNRTLYLARIDGGTALVREGITRIDVTVAEPTP